MAKKFSAKQIAAQKKFVAAVKSGKFRKGKKKAARKETARKKAAPKKRAVKRKSRAVRKSVTVSSLKSRIREKLEGQLKDQLFNRDKATTYKQHRSAQLKIENIRRELRKVN